jgi:hypothetical protein
MTPTSKTACCFDGEIHMIAKQLLSGNHYKVDPYKLQLGDGLQFTPTEPKTSGMITFDLDRGLQIVTIVEANSATINKFPGHETENPQQSVVQDGKR